MPPGYKENLNIIFMRDKGPRHSLKMRRTHYYAMLAFFGCLPFLCILLATQCWLLWKDNEKLRASMKNFESDCLAAQATAERLENLETLLKEGNTPGRDIVIRQLAADKQAPAQPEPGPVPESQMMEEGPGHEEFPVLDTGRVKVGNVQARLLRGNSIRIALDLRNPDNENLLSGEIEATLVTTNGEKLPLKLDRREMGNFRINHFKRAVMISKLPPDTNTVNSEVILEVRNQAGEPVYRNIFSVQR